MKTKLNFKARLMAVASLLVTLICFKLPVYAADDTLKVGMEANYAPFNWTQTNNANGAIPIDGSNNTWANGYDVKIAKIIGKKLGKKVVAVKTEWDGLLPALTSGKIDLIIAGMSPTAERRKAINFSIPYRTSTFVVITKTGSKVAGAKALTDFKGAKLTGQQGTFHYDFIKKMPGAIQETAMRDFAAMRQSLISGTIDGYVAEDTELTSFKMVDPDITAVNLSKMPGFTVSPDEATTAIGVKKANTRLLAQVNAALRTISKKRQAQLMQAAIAQQPSEDKQENWFTSMMKKYGPMLVSGILMTLLIALVGTLFGFLIGLVVGIIKTIPAPLARPARYGLTLLKWILNVYIEVFRGTPMMVQAAVIYYGIAQFWNLNLNRTVAALIIVSINTGAYLAEVIRGGINATPTGQFEAASALGMTHNQRMWHIILPQAIRNSLPSIANEFIVNIKDTSVLSIISVSELFFVGSTIASQSFQFFQTYLVISGIYLLLTFSITRIFNLIEKKLNGPKDYNLMANQIQVGNQD